MAIPRVDPSARNNVELGSVTNWPIVYAAAGVGLLLIVGLAAVGVIALTQATPAPTAAEPVAELRPAPPPRPADATPHLAPAPAAKPSDETPLWKPLVPAPAPVSFPVVKAIVERPDLISVAIPVPPVVTEIQEKELLFSSDLQANVRQIDLDAVEGTSLRLLVNADQRLDIRRSQADLEALKKAPALRHGESVVSLIAHRPDLTGLPVRGELECKASKEAVKCLQQLSPAIRNAVACARGLGRDPEDGDSTDEVDVRAGDRLLIKLLARRKEWLKDEYSAGLTQMLCVETAPVRLQLTKMLSTTKGKNASVALARQTLFDLSSEVRQAALEALKVRPREEYRQTFVDGLRYPLPAVADRAAAALTALKDKEAVSSLEKLLDLPDPSAPVLNRKKKWVVAEIVKVNHFRNCALCHAPSDGKDNPVPGAVPKAEQPIRTAYRANPNDDSIRADVTYLRQDFSVMEEVPDPGKWPARQRFDYMIRQRELTDQEIIDMADGASDPAKSYPQRDAVRRALDKLTKFETDRSVQK